VEFWDIYYQYYERVRKFVLTIIKDEWVADDIIQETFARIQINFSQLKDPTKISAWIFRIAYNLCQDHFRQQKNSATTDSQIEEHPEIFTEPLFHKQLEQQQMGECVQAEMNRLPESLRTVLVLFDVLEFSHKEIAEILDITPENVKVRLHRARKKLKVILEEKCNFERDERNVLICEPIKAKTAQKNK
jgi:RNA polymerase sigma-70 factor (ECF subfamily)